MKKPYPRFDTTGQDSNPGSLSRESEAFTMPFQKCGSSPVLTLLLLIFSLTSFNSGFVPETEDDVERRPKTFAHTRGPCYGAGRGRMFRR